MAWRIEIDKDVQRSMKKDVSHRIEGLFLLVCVVSSNIESALGQWFAGLVNSHSTPKGFLMPTFTEIPARRPDIAK